MKIVKMTVTLIFFLMVCVSNIYSYTYAYDFGINVTINDNRSNTGSNDGYS